MPYKGNKKELKNIKNLKVKAGAQLVGGRGEEVFPAFLENRKKVSWLCKKQKALVLEKFSLFVCIYELNSHLKCRFKSILEKKKQFFPRRAFIFCVVQEKFIEVPLFHGIFLAPKTSWLCTCSNIFVTKDFFFGTIKCRKNL